MRARELFLLLFLLTVGITFSLYEKGELDLYLDIDGWSILAYHQFEFEEETQLTPPLPELIAISNSHGEIKIIGTEEENIQLRLTKIISAKNQEKALEVSQKLHPVINKGERDLLITTNRDEFSRRSFRTNFLIFVPRHLRVDVKNSYGLVRIINLAEVTLQNSHGPVEVEDIQGKVKISNSYKDVRIQNVNQDVIINSKHSEIKVKGASQAVVVNHSYGEIELSDIQGKVTVDAHHCEVKAENIGGQCQIESSYRPIIVFRGNGVSISSRNSAINIIQNQGPMEINNSYGRLRIVGSQGDIKVRGKNLKVTIQDSTGENLILTTSYREVDIRNCKFNNRVNLDTAHNSVYIALADILGPFRISGKYSHITFYWPENLKVPLKVWNKGGKITWKLPFKPHSLISNGTSQLEAFSDEKTPGEVEIKTSYGEVIIRPRLSNRLNIQP